MAEAKMFLCAKAGHVDKNEKKTRPFILFFFLLYSRHRAGRVGGFGRKEKVDDCLEF